MLKKTALNKVALGIGAMFGIYWCYSVIINNIIDIPQFVNTIIGLVSLYGIGFAIYLLIIKAVPSQKVSKGKVPKKTIALCFLLQFTAIMILSMLVNISSMAGQSEQQSIDALSPYSLFMLLIFNPIVEEFVFRKLLADKLYKYGEGFFILVSALCFSIVHGVSLGLPQIAYTFILGLIWSYLYAKTGNFILVVVMHAVSNLFGSIMVQLLSGISMELTGMYSMLMMACAIVGAVLFLVNKKKISVDGKASLFSKDDIKAVFTNQGIWIYIAVTVMFIVLKNVII